MKQRLSHDQFINIYAQIIQSKIPFAYRANGSKYMFGRMPQIVLLPNYRHEIFQIEILDEAVMKSISIPPPLIEDTIHLTGEMIME